MLDVTTDWWWAIIVAAAAGAVGGLVYDLLIERSGNAGMVEGLGRRGRETDRLYDLGVIASILVGAVAAVVFCYFNQPHETTVIKDAISTTTRSYDPIRLIAVSLLVGSAGSSVLVAAQKKLLAAIMASEVRLITAGVVQARDDAAAAETAVREGGAGADSAAAVTAAKAQLDVLTAIATPAADS